MIFTTYWFFAFTAITLAVYWLLPVATLRWWFLAAACTVFHGYFAGPAGMAPIVVLMATTYAAGLTRRRGVCLAAMVLCVVTLCFYKYALFFIGVAIEPISSTYAALLTDAAKKLMPGAPPLGISFFAFEFVHYLYGVRRGGDPIRHPVKFLLFSIFFPSLVAGPIKRYSQFLASLTEGSRKIVASNFSIGLSRIAIGFAKKVAIADNLTFYIDQQQPHFATIGLFDRWVLLACIALRILFDFSGYSDIAIGTAKLFGVDLPENFNWPYLARNIQDFWQRWHISLSSWIRDYIYIPLGGSRHGPVRRVTNGLIAFGLCGLWHGPAWNFVVWGLYHGIGLALCATYEKIPVIGPAISGLIKKEPAVGFVLTQLFVWLGWLVFFYPVAEALKMARLLFGL
jgi:alginate O-acetyltransferase complex protein AlgI